MKKNSLSILSVIFVSVSFFARPSEIGAEEKNSSATLEFQAVEFVEHYPDGWRGIADGGRSYWTFSEEKGLGLFVGYESIRMIPTEPGLKESVSAELHNRLLFTNGFTQPVEPVFLPLPSLQGVDLSVSQITVTGNIDDIHTARGRRFHRTYVGIQTPPRQFALSKRLFFLPGLDVLAGVQYGSLDSGRLRIKMNSPFFAIEPNLRFRVDLSSRASLSLLLPLRLIWMSPVSFERQYGKKRYATDVQGGLAIGIRFRL